MGLATVSPSPFLDENNMSTTEKKSYQPLYLIHRLEMRNKDNQIPFFDRFKPDYMGSTEFERGWMGMRIREMNEHCHVGEIMVDGVFMLAAWNPERFTQREVEREVNRIYHGEQRTKEWTNFNREYRRRPKEERHTNAQWHGQHQGAQRNRQ